MQRKKNVPDEIAFHVRDSCLCLHVQRAARTLARHFDDAFRVLELTSGQFSLLMSLHAPQPAPMSVVAKLLGTDRTTLTAALKPLERRKLVRIVVDKADKRSRLLSLTKAGRTVLAQAVPIWEREHATLARKLKRPAADLRADLLALS